MSKSLFGAEETWNIVSFTYDVNFNLVHVHLLVAPVKSTLIRIIFMKKSDIWLTLVFMDVYHAYVSVHVRTHMHSCFWMILVLILKQNRKLNVGCSRIKRKKQSERLECDVTGRRLYKGLLKILTSHVDIFMVLWIRDWFHWLQLFRFTVCSLFRPFTLHTCVHNYQYSQIWS